MIQRTSCEGGSDMCVCLICKRISTDGRAFLSKLTADISAKFCEPNFRVLVSSLSFVSSFHAKSAASPQKVTMVSFSKTRSVAVMALQAQSVTVTPVTVTRDTV